MSNQPKISISVTSKHIKDGLRNNCHSCPIALCVKEMIEGRVEEISVIQFIQDIIELKVNRYYVKFFLKNGNQLLYQLSDNLTQFIIDFDKTGIAHPTVGYMRSIF